MARVLLVGASGWGNVGDDLIAKRIVEWVKRDGSSVVLAGGFDSGAVCPSDASSIVTDGTIRSRVRLVSAIWGADHVMIGGGGLLDDRSPSYFRPYARVARLSKLLHKPYSLVAVGVGPIRQASTPKQYRAIASGAHSVSVRDHQSMERLRECGVTRPIDVVSDPALWQFVEQSDAVTRFDAAVNLRCWEDSEGRATGAIEGGLEFIVDTVAMALNRVYSADSSIALVSMSCLQGDDDSVALEMLASRLNATISKVYDCSLDGVESTVAMSDHVISMRLHLCLVGVASRKPVVGIGYDPKIAQQGDAHGFPVVDLYGSFSASMIVDQIAQSLKPLNQRVEIMMPERVI